MLAWPTGISHRDGNELRRTVGLGTKFWEENQKIPRLSWQTFFEVKGISKGCSTSKKLPFSLIVLSHLVTQKKALSTLWYHQKNLRFPSPWNDAELHECLAKTFWHHILRSKTMILISAKAGEGVSKATGRVTWRVEGPPCSL